MRDYEHHPLACLLPMMTDGELEAMAKDIKRKKLLEPIWLYEGKILDGRNRQAACNLAGIEPTYQQYTGDNPRGFVVSKNIPRRHLTASQLAMAAARLASDERGDNDQEPEAATLRTGKVTQKQAAQMLNVSPRSVFDAAKVIAKGTPELQKAVESGTIPVHKAARIASQPAVEQKRSIVASPRRPVGAGPLDDALNAITALARRLTILLNDTPEGRRFARYVVDQGLTWVDHREVWVEGRTYGKRFVGLRALRQLLKLSRGARDMTRDEVLAALGEDDGEEL